MTPTKTWINPIATDSGFPATGVPNCPGFIKGGSDRLDRNDILDAVTQTCNGWADSPAWGFANTAVLPKYQTYDADPSGLGVAVGVQQMFLSALPDAKYCGSDTGDFLNKINNMNAQKCISDFMMGIDGCRSNLLSPKWPLDGLLTDSKSRRTIHTGSS
jgi:hypothetical protein